MGDWHSDNTILTMTTNHAADGAAFTLQPNNDYQLRMVVNKAKAADANGLPLILGGDIDLLSSFTFTTGTPIAANPEVLWVTPTPGATKVPTDIYLELGFSQPMDQQSVEASTLRVTNLDNDSNSFEIEIGQAETAGLIDLEWNDDSTILTMTTSHL